MSDTAPHSPESGLSSSVVPTRGWEEVDKAVGRVEGTGPRPSVRKFDEASWCCDWDLASLVDTEEASVAAPADRRDQVQQVKELDELFRVIYPLIRQYELEHASPSEHKVVEYLSSQDLAAVVNLQLPDEGSSRDFIQGCQDALRYSVRTAHPRFMNQLFAGSEPCGQVAELLTSVINNSVHTYGAAPLATVVEQHLIEHVGQLAGFSAADGIFCPGGSYANMGAMLVARNELFPHVSDKGWLAGDRPVVFTSAQAHYSVKKAAMMLGIGTSHCMLVSTDCHGRMRPDHLESLIVTAKRQGQTPFFVSCTSGTTVTGSFDPLRAVVEICRRHGVWVHADGAWGGAVIFSDKHRNLVEGLGGCDSFCFNPHKLLGVSSQCTLLLLNQQTAGHGCCRPGALQRSNDTLADYLFHSASQHDSDDLGHKSLQCGRKPDCLKLWLHWKRHGTLGLARRVNRAFTYAQRLAHLVAQDPRFRLILHPESCNVCFYYIPPSVRHLLPPPITDFSCSSEDVPADEGLFGGHGVSIPGTVERLSSIFETLDSATQTIYRRMQVKGSLLVNYSPLPDHGLPSFFRPVIIQPKVQDEDLLFMLDEIDRIGCDL